ncbi:hypothetical protein BDV06DRAFT_198923 [Aspergillus oleicola]
MMYRREKKNCQSMDLADTSAPLAPCACLLSQWACGPSVGYCPSHFSSSGATSDHAS